METHHILIGIPGSGKTTLALALQRHLPNSEVISTDAIRQDLYGDPAIQGNWSDIFTQVQRQFDQWMTQGKTIIYDATNVKRSWRSSVLRLSDQAWVGWHLTTPIETCLEWNQKRDRQVPEAVIQNLYRALVKDGISCTEGMDIVEAIDISQYPDLPQHLLERLPPLVSYLEEISAMADDMFSGQDRFTQKECRWLARMAIELERYTLPTYGDCLDNFCNSATPYMGAATTYMGGQ